MYKIMLVEDEKKIRDLIKERLEAYDYEVVLVEDFTSIKEKLKESQPHLLLLDINLPNYDGFFWCREIRTFSKLPIIFVSARFSDMDQVMAIENGGDDYIIKPFSFDLLLAKVKSILRRTYGEYKPSSSQAPINSLAGLTINRNKSSLSYLGRSVDLSKREFSLLSILLENLGRIVSREDLLEDLWDDIDFVDDNTLSVNITRLRKKLEELGIYNSIRTKRSQGYIMEKTWGDLNEL